MEVACAYLEPIWPEIHSLLQLLSCLAVVPLLVLQLPNLCQCFSLQAILKHGPHIYLAPQLIMQPAKHRALRFLTSAIAFKGGAFLRASAQSRRLLFMRTQSQPFRPP